MQESIDFDALVETLSRIGYGPDEASEYHGALCGMLCVVRPEQIDMLRLIDAGDRPATSPDAAGRQALTVLRTQTAEALEDDGLSFTPLLPDDEVALVPRVRALVTWCEGFLFGVASRPGLDLSKCSEEVQEVIRDLTQLTQAEVGAEDDANVEETAYAELVEYVRVGTQLVFMELHPRPTLDPTLPQSIH